MTATAPGAPAPPRDARQSPGYRPATFADALQGEWTKLRTVKSTYWSLLVAAVLGIGLGALFSALSANHYSQLDPSDKATWDPTGVSTGGLALAQLAIAVLGVIVMTSEYSSGTIRTSLAAVPRRSRFLTAKAMVFTTVALVTGEIVAFIAFFIGQVLISGHAPTASISDGKVLRAVVGAGLYLAVLGLLSVALGTLLRSAAGAIAVVVAIIFVLPLVALALPTSVRNSVEKYWPTQAGQQVTNVVRGAHTLSAWEGFGVLCLFVGIVVAAAFVVLSARDA